MAKAVKPRSKIDLQFVISLPGAMSIGSGFPAGLLDRTIMQDLNGLPYIPASTLKGRVRDMAERLAHSLGRTEVCHASNPKFMCAATKAPEDFCLICRTFGAAGFSSVSGQTGLTWRDAQLCDESGKEYPSGDLAAEEFRYSRTQVQLSRARGVALAQHLFTVQNSVENLRYHGHVRGWLAKNDESGGRFAEELVLLCAAIRLLNFVGGGKSRGLGRCDVDLYKINFDGQEVTAPDVLQEIERLSCQGGE